MRENADAGTDHGHGNVITVLGGAWPAAASTAPGRGSPTTSSTTTPTWRSPPTTARSCPRSSQAMANPNWAQVFPGYAGYVPLGLMHETIFEDSFETGDTANWSVTQP